MTAKDLTAEDRRRLNGAVERILQKGAYDRDALAGRGAPLVAASVRPRRSSSGECRDRMKRRAFLYGSVAMLAAPVAAEAQPALRVARIGVLSGSGPSFDSCTQALRNGLSALGHVEGQTYHLEIEWAEGDVRAFPRLAADLLRRKVDAIAVTSLAIEAAKEATSTVPLVMTSSSYPVERDSSPVWPVQAATSRAWPRTPGS